MLTSNERLKMGAIFVIAVAAVLAGCMQNGKKDLHADFGRYCYQGLRHSLCHGWSSGVLPFVYEEVLGLKILEPGFKKVSIRPQMTGLDFVEAKIPTPKGIIEVNAERKGVEIRLPDGIELRND